VANPLFWKIKQVKDKFHEKVNEKLRDRVRHEAKETFKVMQRLKNKGLSSERILEEVLKSSEVKKFDEERQK
jgi:hypothetical protein